MTITRERQSDHSGRETCWRGDARPCERSDERVWDFYREYVGSGRIKTLSVSCADSSPGGGAKTCLSLWERCLVGAERGLLQQKR